MQREIRVFISSTFRDMKGERDYLVKFIFPRLRRLCDERQVIWGEVDLRWGVTDEQAAEGKVLPICLEEIKRCRPYFIGLLGERYGWIPDAIPQDVIDREPWLKEHLQGHKSVTELEILHGVLNNRSMADHAFFYFRDPDYLNHLPRGGNRVDFVSETPDAAKSLAGLKDRIRQSGFPVQENYADPKALGELVLNDLTAVIDKLFQKGSEPDPLDKEAGEHEAYAQSRRGVYIGRDEYFERLDAHAEVSNDKPLVVLGESGSGKSALLANWVARYREKHPDVFILQHYIGATPFSADWAQMVRRLMAELKRKLGITQEIPDKPEELRAAFPNWLYMAAAKGRTVLVLDALNQIEDRYGAPDLVWLPPVMPGNVRLVVSTLPGRPLDEVRKRDWPTMQMQPLDDVERRRLLTDFLTPYGKKLEYDQVDQIVSTNQTENPLYLRVLLDELRQFGEYERLQERIDHYLEAESVAGLYARVIARWDEDYSAGIDLVKQSLSLLWAARRGLSESELLEILGTADEPLLRATWSPLFLAMADGLVSRGGLLNFAHDFLRQATQRVCVRSDEAVRAAHLHLADYFEKQSMSPRRTDELPWQLAEGAAWQRLYDLLAQPEFLKACWEQSRFDTKTYWAGIEASSSLRMVEAYREQIGRPEQEVDMNLLWALGDLLGDTGHPKEALTIRALLVAYFKATGDQDNYQAILGSHANTLHLLGDLDGAMALHKEEERICHELANLDGISRSLNNQAVILRSRGDLVGAMKLHKESERICRQLGDLDGVSRSLGNQANTRYSLGELGEAMALHKEEERICRQTGDLDGLQISLGNQALILKDRGELSTAMVLHKEEELICRQLGNLDSLQRTLGNQANIRYFRGELGEAMALHKEEERICRQLGNLDSLQRSLGNQALIMKDCGELDRAMMLHKEEERICRQLENLDGVSRSFGNQALILRLRGDLNGAMMLHKEQERICRQLGNVEGLAVSLANQAVILTGSGQMPGGLLKIEEAYRLASSYGYAALARQIEPNLTAIRQAAQKSGE